MGGVSSTAMAGSENKALMSQKSGYLQQQHQAENSAFNAAGVPLVYEYLSPSSGPTSNVHTTGDNYTSEKNWSTTVPYTGGAVQTALGIGSKSSMIYNTGSKIANSSTPSVTSGESAAAEDLTFLL